jgi:predicted lysophospholipase L1 biosynthesis ABC-type transport system permease subunit
VGLYGVTAYGVARRIPEIGLRMALGAGRASVVRLVLRGAAMQTAIGLLLGVPAALVAGHYLQSQLYEVKGSYNVSILLGACAVLALSALIASDCRREELRTWSQCRRCGRTDLFKTRQRDRNDLVFCCCHKTKPGAW